MRKTGNEPVQPREMDDVLWGILNDAFSSRAGISGDVLLDTNEETAENSEGSTNASPAKGKTQPIVQLANAMQIGMEAIATAMSSQPSSDNQLQSLAQAIERQTSAINMQQQQLQRQQELQLQLLQRLIEKTVN